MIVDFPRAKDKKIVVVLDYVRKEKNDDDGGGVD